MANKKTQPTLEGWIACLVHCVFYTIPFTFIASPAACIIIFVTHFLIDKFRLARYFIRLKHALHVTPNGWDIKWYNTSTGFPEDTPVWLSTWLLFIIDNTIHLTINYFAISLFP